MSGIFISYRREDTGPYAGRLRDSLSQHFYPAQIFRDLDRINPGERFRSSPSDRSARAMLFWP